MKETLLADFTSTAFAEPLIVISETASPSMWLFEPLMTTVFVPAGISTCALDSSIVKVPEASDFSAEPDLSEWSWPEWSVPSEEEEVGAEEFGQGLPAGLPGDGDGGRGGKEGLQGHGVSLSLIGRR